MDSRTSDLRDLSHTLSGQPAFLRAAVEGREDWELRTCHVVVGQKPPGWSTAIWEYESAVLVAIEVDGADLCRSLGPSGGALSLASRTVRVPAVHDSVNVQREPSWARHDVAPLPWPSTAFTVSAQQPATGQGPQGFMVGDDLSPSFTDYQTAVYSFFYGQLSNIGVRSVPNEVARIRLVQTTAWLGRVSISPTKLTVQVRGDARDSAWLELTGQNFHASKKVGRTGITTLRLPNGLPDDAVVYLKRDKQWLDYRLLGPLLYGSGESSVVTVEFPDDSDSRIQALLAAGEGPNLEYKSALPGKTLDEKRRVLKTIAAFATGNGGNVLFGVDRDELTLTGIQDAGDPQIRDRLGNLIRGNVFPTPEFEVRSATIDGRGLLLLSVLSGHAKPYGLQFGDKPVEFYVRRGASTYPATQDEVRSAALSTVARPQEDPVRWRLR